MRTSLLTAAVLLMAGAANAAPIAPGSEISTNGSDTFTGTSLTFVGPGNVGGQSGSFAELPNCLSCVTFPIGSLANGSSGELWSISDNGLSSTLSINGDTTYATDGAAIPDVTAHGTGTLTLSGFDPTNGIWELTGQGPEGTAEVTWSATAVAQGGQPIPEPGSLVILGAVLIGFGFVARKGTSRAAA